MTRSAVAQPELDCQAGTAEIGLSSKLYPGQVKPAGSEGSPSLSSDDSAAVATVIPPAALPSFQPAEAFFVPGSSGMLFASVRGQA